MTEQHAPAAQASTTCPVCKGEETVTGVLRPLNAFEGEPGGQTRATILCPNACHRGQVPALPVRAEGSLAVRDLTQWREEAEPLLDAFARRVVGSLPRLRTHLAAMPQPSVNATEKEPSQAERDRDFWKERYQEQITILENLDPRMDETEELLKAIRRSLWGHDRTAAILYEHVPAAEHHWIRALHREVRELEEELRAAIQQAEAQR